MEKRKKLLIGILASLILVLGVVAAVGVVSHSASEVSGEGQYSFSYGGIPAANSQTLKATAESNKLFVGLAGNNDGAYVKKYGIIGKTEVTDSLSAAVYGERVNSAWGALGYKDSRGTLYGIYGKGGTWGLYGTVPGGYSGSIGGTLWAGYFQGPLRSTAYITSPYLKLEPQESIPIICNAASEGTIYYYGPQQSLRICMGALGWKIII